MKRIFIALLVSTSALAAPNVTIKNFNFEYQDPRGQGTADSFEATGLQTGVTVDVEKQGDDFHFKASGAVDQEFVLRKAPDLLMKAKTISVSDLNLTLKTSAALSVSAASFENEDSSLELQDLSLTCDRLLAHADPLDQLLAGCAQNLTLKSSRFVSRSFVGGLITAVAQGLTGAAASTVGISNLNLKVVKGAYDLTADVKAQISGKAKSYGTVAYDASKKLLTVKITEVKFSILNVTNQVFDELKKNESEKMKVNKPYVYLTLK